VASDKPTTKKRAGRKPKTLPAAPVDLSPTPDDQLFNSKATRERTARVWLKLLGWAEVTVDGVIDGKLEVSGGLLDNLLKTISTTSKELPKFQAEVEREQRTSDTMSPAEQAECARHLKEAGFDGDVDMSPEEEAEYQRVLDGKDTTPDKPDGPALEQASPFRG
jgi:hypothetical protein